jgi:hypothetical protein
MKKTFLAIFLLSSISMFSQNDKVRQSFQRDYPNARDAQWSQTNNQWHSTYKDDQNRNVNAYYDQDGNRVDTHISLNRKDVPQNVDNRANSKYHANGNYQVQRIERPSNPPLFQIRIQTGTKDRTVYMDEQGRERRYNDHH